jgi:hypothetical protein
MLIVIVEHNLDLVLALADRVSGTWWTCREKALFSPYSCIFLNHVV